MHTRRQVLTHIMGAAVTVTLGCRRSPREENMTKTSSDMPVLFVGHGSPMHALGGNPWSQGFTDLGRALPTPKAILVISAHWYTRGTFLTGTPDPRTIHDFSGFPPALHAIEYPAPGDVSLARKIRGLLGEERGELKTDWGFDHGTWSVLRWMYPQANIPVLQLSIDRRLSMREHWEVGRSLRELRQEGVLILGSGNLVHNLRDAMRRMHSKTPSTPDWAQAFDQKVANILEQRDTEALLSQWPDSEHGRTAHPSPDHWIPLLYAHAASDPSDAVSYPAQGFDLGSVSMRNVIFTST